MAYSLSTGLNIDPRNLALLCQKAWLLIKHSQFVFLLSYINFWQVLVISSLICIPFTINWQVENHIVGAPCGVMDQMTSACGEANKLLAMVCQVWNAHVAKNPFLSLLCTLNCFSVSHFPMFLHAACWGKGTC